MIAKPIWFDYVKWGYDKDKEPYFDGWKEGTPPEVIEQYEKDQKRFREAEEQGIQII